MAFKSNRGIINLSLPKEFINEDGSITKVYSSNFTIEGVEYIGNVYPQLSVTGAKILKITLKPKQHETDFDIEDLNI